MIPHEMRERLIASIAEAEESREKAVDVMFELQEHYGWMTDQAMEEAAELLNMTTLELEELATFYDHIYRSPVGKYVIHVCDSAVCWMHDHQRVIDHISEKLGVKIGGTSYDGLFTLLPVCCIGYCDRAPAMTINKRVYGRLSQEKIDRILDGLREKAEYGESE
jgi:NADH-quinone oxidoreductase subunit E